MVDNKNAVPTYPRWSEDQEKLITAPYDYLTQTKGKNLRTQLVALFNSVLRIPQAKLDQVSKIIEMLHTASLLIDDIEDGSNLRRGKPSAHLVYGMPYVINSSNYMYFRALQETIALDSADCIKAFNEELLNLHRGQSLDLYWRDNSCVPTEDEYFNMVMNKTGGLFRLAVRMMEYFSEENAVSLVPLANLFGIIYQVKDDYLNLQGEVLQANKGFCEDISEGKLSFPIVHSLRRTPEDRGLINILKLRTNDDQIKQIALDILKKTGSFEYTLKTLEILKEKSHEWVEQAQRECHDVGDLEFEEGLDAFRAVINHLASV